MSSSSLPSSLSLSGKFGEGEGDDFSYSGHQVVLKRKERSKARAELRRRYVWLAVVNVAGGVGGCGSRVGVDLAPSNPAGSIPRHPMARRAKALAVIRADPNTRDLFLSSGNVRPQLRSPANVTASCFALSC